MNMDDVVNNANQAGDLLEDMLSDVMLLQQEKYKILKGLCQSEDKNKQLLLSYKEAAQRLAVADVHTLRDVMSGINANAEKTLLLSQKIDKMNSNYITCLKHVIDETRKLESIAKEIDDKLGKVPY